MSGDFAPSSFSFEGCDLSWKKGEVTWTWACVICCSPLFRASLSMFCDTSFGVSLNEKPLGAEPVSFVVVCVSRFPFVVVCGSRFPLRLVRLYY